MEHWEELTFRDGASEIRKMRISLIDKFRDEAVLNNVLVMPAGLRDAEVDSLGRTREDEINDHYRSLIRISTPLPSPLKAIPRS